MSDFDRFLAFPFISESKINLFKKVKLENYLERRGSKLRLVVPWACLDADLGGYYFVVPWRLPFSSHQ